MDLRVSFQDPFSQGSGKDKTHEHKQICGIVPGLGGWEIFVYVFLSGDSLWGIEKYINKIPPPKKILGQSRENFVYVFFVLFVFFLHPKVSNVAVANAAILR